MPRVACPPGPRTATVGANVREVREQRGMLQRELADALGAPWTQAIVAKIELGRQNMRVEQLLDLAQVLRVKPTRLLRGTY